MPSPFPGMDPYLEHPGRWPDVHHELISVIREMLNRQLNPRYYVRIEESASDAHFIEIDLLRAGTPLYAKEMLPPHDYLVHLSRARESRRRHHFWPFLIHEKLPVVAIPLRNPDANAALALQAAIETVYAHGAYQIDIDYTRDPVPALAPDQAEWAREVMAVQKPS